MKIEKLTITQKELNEAVGAWLTLRGITIPVENMEKNYGSYGGYKVELQEPVVPSGPAPVVSTETENLSTLELEKVLSPERTAPNA
jgi:hypothetical protein